MSWNVSAIGKPSKVAEKLKADFEKLTYLTKPEDEIAAAVGQAVIRAAEDTTGVAVIKVEASGSMSNNSGTHTHSVSVLVTAVYGFIE